MGSPKMTNDKKHTTPETENAADAKPEQTETKTEERHKPEQYRDSRNFSSEVHAQVHKPNLHKPMNH
ncbi:hypothetical protein PSACC_00670 [Paramicrosporidium saccamoebae]|uniref:Uncharacterized protein n=1 Tax=Paramicrosporidium saccamoebae TaxID=1246581 RepID=A0A2H9TP36_9FUNG|nr:hypothetical protein PSACC_00670 [Paramicrosporidium saccamoebae]